MVKTKKIMKNSIGNEVKVFAETFEQEAYEQVKALADFAPYQNSKIRIMPDSHAGKGCTIGTTMTITDRFTPNLVGVDIGCGMLVVELQERDIDFGKLDEQYENLYHQASAYTTSLLNCLTSQI